jgi:uncharacterized peroxidase-related enzyme
MRIRLRVKTADTGGEAPLAEEDPGPFILPVEEASASSEVAGIFREIHRYYGFVPKLYTTLAHHPPLLKANWQKIRAVMGGGPLGERAKEAIAVTVSQANDCAYCVRIHGALLKKLKVPANEILALLQLNMDEVRFLDPKEKALVAFAHKVNTSAPLVERQDIHGLREAGASDAEIIHTLGVTEVYIAYNKLLVALRVEMERPDRAKKLTYPPRF